VKKITLGIYPQKQITLQNTASETRKNSLQQALTEEIRSDSPRFT